MIEFIRGLTRTTWLSQYPLERALRAKALLLSGRLLDIGCGTKPYQKFFPHLEEYIGLDQPDTPTGSKVIDVYGDALNLPFAEASFDSILSTQTLEHVSDPQKMLCEIARVLKPGGRALLTAPLSWEVHDEPTDYFRFTQYGLATLCQRAGLSALEIRPLGGQWAVVGQTYLNALEQTLGRKFLLHSFLPSLNLLSNLFFGCLDRIDARTQNTPNYLLLTQKPPVTSARE